MGSLSGLTFFFFRWRAYFGLLFNLVYILLWTLYGVTTEYDKRHEYILPDHWWRIVLLVRNKQNYLSVIHNKRFDVRPQVSLIRYKHFIVYSYGLFYLPADEVWIGVQRGHHTVCWLGHLHQQICAGSLTVIWEVNCWCLENHLSDILIAV